MRSIQAVSDRLRVWWQGQHCPPANSEGSGLVFLSHYRRHWSSSASHAAWELFQRTSPLDHRAFGLLVAILVKAR